MKTSVLEKSVRGRGIMMQLVDVNSVVHEKVVPHKGRFQSIFPEVRQPDLPFQFHDAMGFAHLNEHQVSMRFVILDQERRVLA